MSRSLKIDRSYYNKEPKRVSVGCFRGGLVIYRGHVYYFQPNGNSCHLYDRLEDVGHRVRAAHSTSQKVVQEPTDEDIQNFFDHPRPKRDYPPDPPRNINVLVLPPSKTRITIPVYDDED